MGQTASMPPAANRLQRIEQALGEAFPGDALAVEDLSAQHAGHAGFDPQGSHFRITLSSRRFNGLTRIQRHRLVYDALASMLKQEVHSVVLDLRSPDTPAASLASGFGQAEQGESRLPLPVSTALSPT